MITSTRPQGVHEKFGVWGRDYPVVRQAQSITWLLTRLFIIWWLNTIPALCCLQYTFYSVGLALLHPKKQEGSVQYTNPQQPMKIWVALFKGLPHIYICIHNNTQKYRFLPLFCFHVYYCKCMVKNEGGLGMRLCSEWHPSYEWRIGFTSRHGKGVLAIWQNLLLDILCY